MTHAIADIGSLNFAVSLVAGHHELSADESLERGGGDIGPAPHELLCAALGACTAITLRMYAVRKEWSLEAVHVDITLEVNGEERVITRKLRFEGSLDKDQRARLADIAERTPVTLTLKRGALIRTFLE